MSTHALGVDPLDSKNHGKPIWVVYGVSEWWPQLLCVKLVHYTSPRSHVCIWGASRWRGKHDFRTLGVDVTGWAKMQDFGPVFFDVQSDALEFLRALTLPPGAKRTCALLRVSGGEP
jgi:hypothetical protein